MQLFLEEHGHESAVAENGELAIDMVSAYKPGLILCDLAMPKMEGLEMIRRLRARMDDTPVFVLATQATPAQMQEGKRAGVSAWMIKPFKPRALLGGIERIMKNKRSP